MGKELISEKTIQSPETLGANSVFTDKSKHYQERLQENLRKATDALSANEEVAPAFPRLFETLYALREIEQDFDEVTGAQNGDKFHETIGNLPNEYHIDQDPETGELKLDSVMHKHGPAFVLVSLDNLAAINSSGSHASGDRALFEVSKGIFDLQEKESLKAKNFILYRTSGKDFCVFMQDSHDQKMEDPQKAVQEVAALQMSELDVLGLEIGSKLNVSFVRYEDAVDIFNAAQKSFPVEQRTFFSDDVATFKYINQILVNTIDAQREYLQVSNMAREVYAYLDSAHSKEPLEVADPTKGQYAKEYYEGYLKKFLVNSEYNTWESFAAGFLDESDKITTTLQKAAIDHTVRRIFSVWDTQDNLTSAVKEVILTRLADKTLPAPPAEALADNRFKIDSIVEHPSPETVASLDLAKFKEAHKPAFLETIENLKGIAYEIALKANDYQFSLDRGDNLNVEQDAPIIIENLHKFLTEVYPNIEKADVVRIDIAKDGTLDLKDLCETALALIDPKSGGNINNLYDHKNAAFISSIGHALTNLEMLSEKNIDRLTGLHRRNEFRRRAYSTIGYALKNDLDYSMCVGDMNDLNYASTFGHREYGDAQLVLVGDAINRFKPEGGAACRYGGDEVAMLVPGNVIEGREVAEQVDTYMQTPEQRIPRHAKAHPDFDTFNPRISWGIYSLSEAKKDFEENLLKNENIYSAEDISHFRDAKENPDSPYFEFYTEEITKFMLRVADYSIDYVKAASKANLLYKTLYAQGTGLITTDVPRDDRRWRSFNMRLTAAQKSLRKFDETTFARLHEKHVGAGTKGLTVTMVEDELGNGNQTDMEENAYKVAVTKVTEQLIRDKAILAAKKART